MADVNPKVPLVQFPFSAGIDESARAEVVEAGAGWLVLENGRQDQTGGYSTRNGFTALGNTAMASIDAHDALKVFADGTSICRVIHQGDGSGNTTTPCFVDSYDAVSGQWVLLDGQVPEVAQRLIDMPSPGGTNTLADVAYANGYICLVWVVLDNGNAYAAIINATTFAVVQAPTLIDAAIGGDLHVVAVGSAFIATWSDFAITSIKASYISTASGATIAAGWTAMTDLAADFSNSSSVCSLPHATLARAAIVYNNSSGGASRVTVTTFNTTGVLETVTLAAAAPMLATAIAGIATDTLWVSWDQGTAVKVCGLSPLAITTTPLASTATIITAATGAGSIGMVPLATAGSARLIVGSTATILQSHTRSVTTTAGAATGVGSQATVYAVRPVGLPWIVSSSCYVPVIVADGLNVQQQVIVVEWSSDQTWLRPVACPAPGLAVTNSSAPGYAAITIGDKVYMPLTVARSGVAKGSALVELDYSSTRRFSTCSFGNSVYMSGGVTYCSTGSRVNELGFLVRPPTPTTTTAGTGLTFSTGVRYVAVYEDVDADGNWIQSGISTPSSSTGAVANKTITVSTAPLTVSNRIDILGLGGRVAWYRTVDGAVAPYYRLGTTLNDTSASAITYADTTSDTTLLANAKLYEQPGILGTSQDKRPPPGLSFLTSYSGMLVGAAGSDVWYSGQNVSGEGAWFNPVFQVPVPGEGDITALAVMDGTLFVFKRRDVYAIVGEPPSDNGQSGGLGVPRRLACDVGCIESRSTCTTALGIFFQSDRGIEVLTRAQTVSWIGQPVQVTLAAYPIVTSATVDPVSCCVLIECAAGQTSGLVTGSGRTLVYDLSLNLWTSVDRRTSSAGTADAPSQSACMIYAANEWRYAWMTSTARVHYDDSTTHCDANGSMVCKRAVCANVKLAGMQGLQHVNRAQLLARYHTPHDLSMSYAYDYSDTFKTSRVYSAAELLALTTAIPNMQLEHPMHEDARCEAVRVQLLDVTPSSGTLGTGQGATWLSLCFEVVPQTGAYQVPDASR